MTPEYAIDIFKELIYHTVLVAAPILLTAMLIGLIISLIQAITTVHEQTLSFVPKAIGIVVVLILLFPWMLRIVGDFTTRIIQRLPDMVR